MNYYKGVLLLLPIALSASGKAVLNPPRINFDRALVYGTKAYKQKFEKNRVSKLRYQKLKSLFERNYRAPVRSLKNETIPRIIHQIWVGGTKAPNKVMEMRKSWKKLHPQWKHKLWLDKDVKKLRLRNRIYYDATSDPIEKANILRYEILEQKGGLYVDIDFICLKAFDPFHARYDFYTGIAPHDCSAFLNNALIACGPGHPLISHCIDTISKDIHRKNRFERTGVHHYSRSFFEYCDKSPGVTVALPPCFFYPLGKKDNNKRIDKKMCKETYAIHYWASTTGMI